jgi:hypothetical protein
MPKAPGEVMFSRPMTRVKSPVAPDQLYQALTFLLNQQAQSIQ